MNDSLVTTEIVSASPLPASKRCETRRGWGRRTFEGADTNRLNRAHWQYASDVSTNTWIREQLGTLRARSALEFHSNPTFRGVIGSVASDVVGRDGPTLQVLSPDETYNRALETTWRTWFRAPTTKQNVSGTAWLKTAVRGLCLTGELCGRFVTDPQADGTVRMRILPVHPRWLSTPSDYTGDPNVFMGIRFSSLGRPTQYYLAKTSPTGIDLSVAAFDPIPPDLMIHEFLVDEEEQCRGVPWFATALQPMADLRDYDDQVQDAARQIADQSALLYTDHPNVELYEADDEDEVDVQRRTIRMVPPGWKPFIYTATQPPVQYPDYRAERLREIGRPIGMPLLMVRLDSSRHNYSSARLDRQNYLQTIEGLQDWLSGTPSSVGLLGRLVDEVAREARFSIPDLRDRPAEVAYSWTWPRPPHVDPQKERSGETTGLESSTLSYIDALAANGKTLDQQIAELRRVRDAFLAAGLPLPPWLATSGDQASTATEPSTNTEETADATA